MRILCTHPGRHGDLLWALPTLRALARTYDVPIDLLLSPGYSGASFRALLAYQDYIGTVSVAEDWAIVESAPITPRVPPTLPEGYDHIVHLAYEGWPTFCLPLETYQLATTQVPIAYALHLDQAWLKAPLPLPSNDIAVGFSDEYYEVKVGLYWLLREHFCTDDNVGDHILVNVSGGPRWANRVAHPPSWVEAASWIASARVFVGCCSALHVIACAVGTPAVLAEPAPARHHPVFYPFSSAGPEVILVTGLDGQPTVDSRHLIDAVSAVLAVRQPA